MLKDIDPIDFGFILFCIFVGSGVSYAFGTNKEGLSIGRRLYLQFAAFFFVGLLALIATTKLKWSYEYVSLFGLMLAIGGYQFLHLAWKAYEDSQSIIEFLQLLGRAVSEGYKVFTSVKKGPSSDPDEDTPTTP